MVGTSVLGSGVVSIDSGRPGHTIAVICNVHGNEPCGRASLRRVLDHFAVETGKLVIIDANPEAALLDQRYISADMNRMFTEELLTRGNPHHDLARAQYLATLIPGLGLDYAVDLHSTSSATKFPSAVGFAGAAPVMQHCPIARISGWNETFMAGTLVEWLCRNGVPAVTIEAGQHRSDHAIDVAERVLLALLSQFGVIAPAKPDSCAPARAFEITNQVAVANAASFRFTRSYRSFDELCPEETIARDSLRDYCAPAETGYSILMPGDQSAINRGTVPEAYYLIRDLGGSK